jgi:hypothetical protein
VSAPDLAGVRLKTDAHLADEPPVATILPESARSAGHAPRGRRRLYWWLVVPLAGFALWQLASVLLMGCASTQLNDSGRIRTLQGEINRIGAPGGSTGGNNHSSSQNGLGAKPWASAYYEVPGDTASVEAAWVATLTAGGYSPTETPPADHGEFRSAYKHAGFDASLDCLQSQGDQSTSMLCTVTLD